MTEIIIGTIVGVVLTIVLGKLAYECDRDLFAYMAAFSGVVTFVGVVLLFVFGFSWKSAQYRADIINREYKTEYTKEEIFYAEDVIETIQQIQRTRIEVQGLEEK